MAKKKQELTSEELLAEALVREEDWPYEVPGNWVWVRLDKVLLNLTDGSHFSPKTVEKGYPYITVRDLTNGTIDFDNCKMISKDDYDTLSRNNCQPFEGDVLFSKDGTVGKVALIDFNRKFVVLSSLAILKPNIKIVISEYIEKVLTSPQVLSQAINSKTGTAIKRLVLKNLKNILVPLPPLAEQQRIVDRIESLFDKLDLAKELVQEALDSFENRKAAIFHQAFTGELTKKWREAHGVGLESWEEKPISNYIISLNQGWSPKCESFPSLDINEWGVIKTTAIQHMEFNEIENKQLPKHLEPKVQYELIDGDILITRAGPRIRVGVCCLVKNVRPKLLLCDKAYRIRLNSEKVLNEFFVMQLNTNEKLFEINKMKTGISDSGVNLTQKGFLEIQIKVPPLKEQQEIVRILDDLFEKEQNAKDLCDLIDQIEAIKKTILGQAFRGELGTNEAGEESAVALLEAVLQ